MVELNEKAHSPKLAAALREVVKHLEAMPEPLRGPFLVEGLKPYIPAHDLPAPDDGLVERGIGIVWRWADWIISASEDMDEAEWPSASRDTVKADRDAVIVALQSQAEQIERLTRENEADRLRFSMQQNDLRHFMARADDLEQQVQKLTADKASAIGLLNHLISWIVHDCGAEVPFTDEQDAVFADLETQEGGE